MNPCQVKGDCDKLTYGAGMVFLAAQVFGFEVNIYDTVQSSRKYTH